MFTFFMARELEGAVAKISHLTLAEEELTVTWSLPVSKTDYAATGCRRTWGALASIRRALGRRAHFMPRKIIFTS